MNCAVRGLTSVDFVRTPRFGGLVQANGDSPLHCAVRCGQLNAVRLLLAHSDCNAAATDGELNLCPAPVCGLS